MHLVRRTDDLPSIVDDINRIVIARRQSGTGILDPDGTGDENLPVLRTSAIRARASGLSVRMKGIDVSGQTTMSGRLAPS